MQNANRGLGKKGHNRVNGIVGDQLLSIIQRVERLEEEKAGIASDIKDVLAEARGNGYDTKTIKEIIKLRKLNSSEREEQEALLDIYKAALGMLGGTPLGEAALRKLSPKGGEEGGENPAADDAPVKSPQEQLEPDEKDAGPSLDEARDLARQAAGKGEPVTKNPFPARDPRRAAWDEEWCRHSGSDGMEIPDAWRRASKRDQPKEAA